MAQMTAPKAKSRAAERRSIKASPLPPLRGEGNFWLRFLASGLPSPRRGAGGEAFRSHSAQQRQEDAKHLGQDGFPVRFHCFRSVSIVNNLARKAPLRAIFHSLRRPSRAVAAANRRVRRRSRVPPACIGRRRVQLGLHLVAIRVLVDAHVHLLLDCFDSDWHCSSEF